MNKAFPSTGRALWSTKTTFSRYYNYKNKPFLIPVRSLSKTLCLGVKIAQFSYCHNPCEVLAAIITHDNYFRVVDINKADPCICSTVLGILWNDQLDKVKELSLKYSRSFPLSDVILRPPVMYMDKVLCVALNYEDSCKTRHKKANCKNPGVPVIHSKFSSCIIGPFDPIKVRFDVTQQVDWEVELAVVMGCLASRVSAADAYKYVAGFTVAQDISARDWQKKMNGGQFLLGKAMDTFCPIGPWIVTIDEVEDPMNLRVKCCVNGVKKQVGNTCHLIHSIPRLIERISSVMTLFPGDLILTGTPGGLGMSRCPPEYLKPGDILTSEVQNIGVLINSIQCM